MSGEIEDAPAAPTDSDITAKIADFKLERYKIQLAVWKAERDALATQVEAYRADYRLLREDVYKSYLDVASKQFDRALTRGQIVSTAAGAIATIYGAVLGLRFVIGSTTIRPLPTRGLIPTVFLGLAIVLSIAYLSYLTPPRNLTTRPKTGNLLQDAKSDRDDFIDWSSMAVGARRYVLHMSIVSLGLGVVFLPIAFLDIKDEGALVPWLIVSGGAVLFGPLVLNVLAFSVSKIADTIKADRLPHQ